MNIMRVIAKGQVLSLSGTQCYTASTVLEWIRKKIELYRPENQLKLDFCGEFIPFTEENAEFVAQLVTTYHNTAVRENITGNASKNPYVPYSPPEEPIFDEEQELQPEDDSEEPSWDEEEHGEQQVYDAEFERHEELVPWNMMKRKEWAEEKYGLYV